MNLVTVIQRARELGMKVPTYGLQKRHVDEALRLVYFDETGRDPSLRHETGVARAQWEYGLRGTSYYGKEQRAAVLELSERKA